MKSFRAFLSLKTHVRAFIRFRWAFEPLHRLYRKIKLKFENAADLRSLDRYRCQIDGAMISERLAQINGRVKDVSAGGCLFRPASFYLVDRIGDQVSIELPETTLNGKVVRTLPIGYAVQFEKILEDGVLKSVLAQSAVEATVFKRTQEDETRDTKRKANEKKKAA
ncbi:MAG: PilZ domain-containing protein [Pseudomonadota bacterium]